MTLKLRIHNIYDGTTMDRALSNVIGIYLLLNAANSAIQNAFSISESRYAIVRLAIQAVMLIVMIRPILHFHHREWNVFLIWEILGLFAYGYSYIVGVSLSRLQSWGITTLGTCIPLGVFAYLISDKKILYKTLIKFSWPILAVLALDMFGSTDESYNMHFSYAILFIILLHSNEWITFKKTKYVIPVAVEFVMLLAHGSRGALLCAAVFYVVKIFANVSGVKRYIYSFLILMVFGVLYFTIQNLGITIYWFLAAHGYASRTWRLLLLGNFLAHDSGRNELWEITWNCIKMKPLQGWGIRGAVNQMAHPYPHQLFLDLMLSFGVPIGGLLSILAIRPGFHIFKVQRGYHKDLLIILMCAGLISLMFSGTVFTSYYYFLFFGLGLSKHSLEFEEG